MSYVIALNMCFFAVVFCLASDILHVIPYNVVHSFVKLFMCTSSLPGSNNNGGGGGEKSRPACEEKPVRFFFTESALLYSIVRSQSLKSWHSP